MKAQMQGLVEQLHNGNISYSESVREFKKRYIFHILDLCDGNQCKAARILGMHRNSLSRTMHELGIPRRYRYHAMTPQEIARDCTRHHRTRQHQVAPNGYGPVVEAQQTA